MTNIYVIKYNNYFNRIVKREGSLTDYLTGEYQISPNYSFNPNDDATGDIVVNFNLNRNFRNIFFPMVCCPDADGSSSNVTEYISYNLNIVYPFKHCNSV